MVFSNYSMFLLDYQINVVMRHTTSPAPTRLSRASIGIQSIDAGPLRRRDNRLSKEHIMCTLLRKGQKNKKTIEGWHYSLCGKMNKSSDMPDFLHCDRKASQMPDNQSLSISQYTSYDVSRQLKIGYRRVHLSPTLAKYCIRFVQSDDSIRYYLDRLCGGVECVICPPWCAQKMVRANCLTCSIFPIANDHVDSKYWCQQSHGLCYSEMK